MKKLVISLGGSVIVPDEINIDFLEQFKKTLRKYYKDYRFVVVCGGGAIARKYIEILKKDHKKREELDLAGIRATRMNSLVMMQFFGKEESNDFLPMDMKDVENALKKNKVVFCGALRYSPQSTSDSTASKLAAHLKTNFINITNVNGFYDKDPNKYKNAKLISRIDFASFEKIAHKMKSQPGQHFVLDQNASTLIKENKIKTYIIGKDLKQLENVLKEKEFKGTLVS
jgi:uridylate kinase